MKIGVNVDPRLGFHATDIAGPGVTWIRSVVRPDHDLGPWLSECHAANLKVLVVVARESLKRGWTYRAAADTYARRYGKLADAWQIGNEPDQRSPSSWTLPTAKLNRLILAFRRALGPTATIVGPGLVSGQPSYLDTVSLGALDAGALHPYGRSPSAAEPYAFGPVEDLVALYRRFQKPIWVTEFGGPSRDFASEHERAEYHSKMLIAMRDAGVETAFVFAWSDAMVDGFGLLDVAGKARESYAAFFDGARALDEGRLVNAIDVSSYQSADLADLVRQYHPAHIVVRLYLPWEKPNLPPGESGQDHSRAQIASAQANDCTVGGYCWLYRGADPFKTAVEAIGLAVSCGLTLPVLWIDVETYQHELPPAERKVWLCADQIERTGIRAGVYTSRSMWALAGGGTSCSGFLLWDALQNAWLPPDAGYEPGYGGWAVASGRQWTSEGVDRDVFLAGVTQ